MMKVRLSFLAALFALLVALAPGLAQARCLGEERWPVKVASDPERGDIHTSPIDATIADLNRFRPSDAIGGHDESDRMEAEKQVYRVHGYLGFWHHDPRDSDYHLAITDRTGRVTTHLGAPTGHSFVAEIPDPECFAGADEQYPDRSRFRAQIERARADFEAGIADINPRRISPGSIPVTITGVLFFDFPHGQIGRSRVRQGPDGKHWVAELHPVLSIEFDER